MTYNICLDQRRPARLSDPHGSWWLTFRLPLSAKRHLYVGASTGRRFVTGSPHAGAVLVDRARLAVIVMPRKFYGGRRLSGWVKLHRWCAHVHVVQTEETQR